MSDIRKKPGNVNVPVEIPADFPITKLPPGRVPGAGDLHSWAQTRRAGGSGDRDFEITVRCARCGHSNKLQARHAVTASVKLFCEQCREPLRLKKNRKRGIRRAV